MNIWVIVIIVAAAAAVLGAIVALFVLAVLASGGISAARFALQPVRPDHLDDYLESEASFAVTVQQTFPNPPEQVFAALLDERYFSWLPFSKGVDYGGTQSRAVGTKRAFINTFGVLAEQIVLSEPTQRLGVTLTSASIPLVLHSAAEDFALTPTGSGGTALVWRVGGTPRWVGWLPLRLGAPFVRPFAKWQLGRLRSIMAGK